MSSFYTDTRLLEVLSTALHSEATFAVGNEYERVPSILKIWPEITNPILAIWGVERQHLAPGALPSYVIWSAIETYVWQNGLAAEWNEVWASILPFCYRPEGDSLFCGHVHAILDLPRSRMEAAGLGPLSMIARSWEKMKVQIQQPNTEQEMVTGCMRYALWSACYRETVVRIGGAAFG